METRERALKGYQLNFEVPDRFQYENRDPVTS